MAEEARLIGGRMRERREELKLTQREVAERIPGKTQGADISRYETGRHRPGSDLLDLIAPALETTVSDIISGPKAERQAPAATPDLMGELGGSGDLNRVLEAIAALDAKVERLLQRSPLEDARDYVREIIQELEDAAEDSAPIAPKAPGRPKAAGRRPRAQ